MICPECNVIELTEIEEQEHARCMKCSMIRVKKYGQLLGDKKTILNPVDFGRTLAEKKEFDKEVDEYEEKPEVTKPVVDKDDFQSKVNSAIGTNIFKQTNIKKITVTGASEDIKLTLEIPEIYPVNPKYYADTKTMLEEVLYMVIHTLAFGPMIDTTLETHLAKKFGILKDGPN